MVLHECSNCEYTTNNNCHLKRHLNICDGTYKKVDKSEFKYQCTGFNCVYISNDKSNFNKHLKTCKKIQNTTTINNTTINNINNNNNTINNITNNHYHVKVLPWDEPLISEALEKTLRTYLKKINNETNLL